MSESFRRLRLIHIVLATLLVVGLLPLAIAGWLLSDRSADELRSIEGRYQVQFVQSKAGQIEAYVRRYSDVAANLAQAIELTGGVGSIDQAGSRERLERAVDQDANLIALSILPVSGEPHTAYKPDVISREEVFTRNGEVLGRMNGSELIVGRPRLIRSSQEMSLAIAAPVLVERGGTEQVAAAVVAVISFGDAFRTVHGAGANAADEATLLESGAPVFFVVDDAGRAVAHPDARVAFSESSMIDLKVVRDWIETGAQIESALAPFAAERGGRAVEMLGSFATAHLGADKAQGEQGARLGVIAIQDEAAALRSVGEMRRQTLMISFVASLIALVIGFFFARQLSRPVADLAAGAHRIAAGDFSQRIQVANRTELGALAESFNSMTDRLEATIEDLRRAAGENRELFLGTVKALAAAIDGKDPYTRGHSDRVSQFSVAIAEELKLPADEIETLRISALLHDVGKIGIDDQILKKPAPLTQAEFELMKQHPEIGYRIMSFIPAMKDYLPGILMHHEMLNGGGYPRGFAGDQIPLQARIIAVADTFDACTTERPYQRAMGTEDALMILKKFIGTRYEARVVGAMIDACTRGTIVPESVRHAAPQTQSAPDAASQEGGAQFVPATHPIGVSAETLARV